MTHANHDQVLVNHLGYPLDSPISLVYQTKNTKTLEENRFVIVDPNLKPIHEFQLDPKPISNWHTGHCQRLQLPPLPLGFYGIVNSQQQMKATFNVVDPYQETLVETLADYFFNQRSQGAVDDFDHQVPLFGEREHGVIDAHGGWFDASGDVSKYLSHLSYANYLAPQQIPLVVWCLIRASQFQSSETLKARLVNEALFGASFLLRMFSSDHYFYQIVFDRWSKDVNQRSICNYATQKGFKSERWECSFRQGGGMAIAALAACARLAQGFGDSELLNQCKAVAISGFEHLLSNNHHYHDNGRANIIDDYCALLAAVELFGATGQAQFKKSIEEFAQQLVNKQTPHGHYNGYWRVEEHYQRPYFHASDSGLPLMALAEAYRVLPLPEVKDCLEKQWQLSHQISHESFNPFGYPRHLVNGNQELKSQFFFPHENESGYWWQGENARLGSLACAAQFCSPLLSQQQQGFAEQLHWDCQNWLLGLNPFGACMIEGLGRNNPQYRPDYPGLAGGICNGITSSLTNEADIALCETDDPNHNWRWGEQWIPHAAWWLLSFSMASSRR
mgnify:FL=1